MKKLTLAEFNELSQEEKRIAVAKDVIAMVCANKLLPESGSIVFIYADHYNSPTFRSTSFKDFIKADNTQCAVCARGSLLASYVGYVNELTIEKATHNSLRVTSEHASDAKLKEIFSVEQLALIETAFEGDSMAYSGNGVITEEDEDEAHENYYLYYYDEEERLLAIMENIIENNGTFVP